MGKFTIPTILSFSLLSLSTTLDNAVKRRPTLASHILMSLKECCEKKTDTSITPFAVFLAMVDKKTEACITASDVLTIILWKKTEF